MDYSIVANEIIQDKDEKKILNKLEKDQNKNNYKIENLPLSLSNSENIKLEAEILIKFPERKMSEKMSQNNLKSINDRFKNGIE